MRSLFSFTLFSVLVSAATGIAADNYGPQPYQPRQTARLQNIELSKSGSLVGQFITETAQPLADIVIAATTSSGRQTVKTDRQGRFELNHLKGGQCVLQIGEATYACRLWVNGTAPPGSRNSIVIVKDDQPLVRGQSRFSRMARLGQVAGGQKVALGLLIAGGTTVAIVASETDGS
ncbi:MAG: hypothetical protein Fues2KO_14870 [Fuerstiella sp.]